ncbi:tetratricopeptide repeat protein [Rubinisphaera brasiliensis]|uniref:Tetratricopeptide TPR_1 repeat-containing protein n=1 Tax=Rubinisphaera brasiliensis (strain ATCC 49424 / DSM 5305 / JCM 21570 / IAM 15109 / NBRC 103401 / IFAM 1448) TaxID=756272 RepID=F0SM71_RUBBR|nr:tetratricopeptide repeat protein [Rubinisphaera brasiliensis]ADY61026.1 Tetratricopeptide TPR_1 repeat-containing protein [Rubinisphaera brasiliensis DSM 5305]
MEGLIVFAPPLSQAFWIPTLLAASILAGNPLSAQAQPAGTPLEQAQQAYDANQYEQALKLAEQVLQSEPKNDRALFIRASAKVEMGIETGNAAMIRDGVADARSAIEVSQSQAPEYYLPYLFGMTNLSLLEDRPEHVQTSITVATQIIDQLEMSDADKANMLYQRGLAKLQQDDTIDGGVADFKAAVALQPKHMASLTALADAYAMAEQNENALAAFNQFIAAYPEHPIGYNNRGMFHKQMDDTQAALQDFQKAVELQPKFFVAQINLGYMLMESGKPAEAEKVFSNAIALQEQNPSVYGLRANVRMRQGKSQEAIADYEKAIELFPRNPLAHADLGFAYFFLKQYGEAFKQFDEAMTINGKLRFLDPWIYASMVLSGQVQEANSRFAGTLAKPTEERDWIDLLTLYLMGKVNEDSLLSSVNPDDKTASVAQTCEGHYFIGLRQSNLGSDSAQTHFQKCIETGASHLSAYRAAQFELQNFDK